MNKRRMVAKEHAPDVIAALATMLTVLNASEEELATAIGNAVPGVYSEPALPDLRLVRSLAEIVVAALAKPGGPPDATMSEVEAERLDELKRHGAEVVAGPSAICACRRCSSAWLATTCC